MYSTSATQGDQAVSSANLSLLEQISDFSATTEKIEAII
ncbi:hypothetical protein E2C01_093360 [Portunus trituberculatus]|uniref:Uncharacterized protein n=1 Tax=Portunus trituberculatus TaxID=210409 RepID=A0A5B7JIS2_PORTR|nr:hypothetical protein [Portunus trituberculatus]